MKKLLFIFLLCSNVALAQKMAKNGIIYKEHPYVNCWIEAESILQASAISCQKIEDRNWKIIETEDAFEIEEDHYSENSNGYKYYNQALIDKLVFVYHTYPN